MKQKIVEALVEAGIMEAGCDKLEITRGDATVDVVELMLGVLKNNALDQVIEDVREFCEVGGQIIRESVEEWTQEEREFRLGLITEETKELMDASEQLDSVEERDALIDIIYVGAGYALQRGIAGNLSSDWRKIADNNMTKFCISEEEARETVANNKRKLEDCYYDTVVISGKTYYPVKRKSDGKILKPIRFVPVKLG